MAREPKALVATRPRATAVASAGELASPPARPMLVSLTTAGPRTQLRMATVFQIAVSLLLIANLGRIPVFSTGGRDVPILVNDLVVVVTVLLGAAAMTAHRVLRLDRVSMFMLLFAGIGAISAMLAVPRFGLTTFEAFVSMGYLARWLLYFALYVVAINTLRASDVDRVWTALETTILIFAAFGIFQSAFLPGFAQMVYPDARLALDWDVQGRRLVSTFLDPNFAGIFIDTGLIVCFSRLAVGARVAGWKLLILGVALALTISRGSILALLVGGFTVLVLSGFSKRLVRAIAAGIVVLLIASPKLIAFARGFNKLGIDKSALARLEAWAHAWTVFKDHWVLGIGFNTWGYVAERYGWLRLHAATYGIDGGLLFVLVMTGVIGFVFYVAALVSVAIAARRVWRTPTMSASTRGLAIGAAAMIPTIIVSSMFVNSLMHPFLMETMWLLWALPFVAKAR